MHLGVSGAVTAHAILQATGFEAPLAAKPPIIFCAFPFASLSHAGSTKNQSNGNQQYCAIIPHRVPPMIFGLRPRTMVKVTKQGQVKVIARLKYWLYWLLNLTLPCYGRN